MLLAFGFWLLIGSRRSHSNRVIFPLSLQWARISYKHCYSPAGAGRCIVCVYTFRRPIRRRGDLYGAPRSPTAPTSYGMKWGALLEISVFARH